MPDDPSAKKPLFVSTDWLSAHLGEPDLQIIDGSWYLPTDNRDAKAEYLAAHVPGAIFFDIDAISDPSSGLPHMLPDTSAFAHAASALGIRADTTLVVYDGAGLFSAPRVWWTLRHFGAGRVFLLAGGLPKWRAEGQPVESGPSNVQPALFEAEPTTGDVADLGRVQAALDKGNAQVIDARPAARFTGEVPEPRPGVRSGHMPGSTNLPFPAVINDGQLKSPDELRQAFEQAGIDLDRPVIASCGSGVSAAILVLALESLGKTDTALYDGSWAEYGSRHDLPIATGA